jgi:hypothetical protein
MKILLCLWRRRPVSLWDYYKVSRQFDFTAYRKEDDEYE